MNEEWRDIPGWEGCYQVSNLGNVRSLTRKTSRNIVYGCMLRPGMSSGYLSVNLWRNQKSITRKIHNLVLLAFVGKPPSGFVTNHIDGNRKNNSLANLEYCTYTDNMLHALNTGLRKTRGELNAFSVITNEQAVEILETLHNTNTPISEIAAQYGVSLGTIYHINNGSTWKWLKLYPFPVRVKR